MAYLDANATEPLRPEARAAVIDALDLLGNPSSIHRAGREARRVLEASRRRIAARFGASADGVVFTSGGTEADALAVAGLGAGRRILIGATEHDAIRAAAPDAAVVPVDGDGTVDLPALERLLAVGRPALLCLMLANNETGTLQPIVEAAALCRRFGALLHVDAVPAAGRVPVDLGGLGADSLALSGHKLGGPKGAGALLLPAIAGFAAACEAEIPDLLGFRGRIERAAIACGALVLGGPDRLPNTVCLAMPEMRAEAQVIALDLAGVAVSAGSACSSGKVSRSHVLTAMGCGALAGEAIRVSLPWNTTEADIAAFETAYAAITRRAGRVTPSALRAVETGLRTALVR